jgi:hypothetical protein
MEGAPGLSGSSSLAEEKPTETPEIYTHLVATWMESGNLEILIKVLSNN